MIQRNVIVTGHIAYMSYDQLKQCYLYSLQPNYNEYKIMFGKNANDYYNEALLNRQHPTFVGLLKYIRNFHVKNPKTILISSRYSKAVKKITDKEKPFKWIDFEEVKAYKEFVEKRQEELQKHLHKTYVKNNKPNGK